MSTKLFIGKLSYDTTDESLRNEFAKYGTVVSASVIMDRDNGRSKGFGFVEMDKPEEAQAAIAALHEKDFEGRMVVVSLAKPREERPQSNNNFGGGFQRR